MTTPGQKLADTLEVMKSLQETGKKVIQSSDLSRTHQERLQKNGFLQPVIKGWYIISNPDAGQGETIAWYTSFWSFCAAYLDKRFKQKWCLSPEQSLQIQVGNWTVPTQLLVQAPSANNNITLLLRDLLIRCS